MCLPFILAHIINWVFDLINTYKKKHNDNNNDNDNNDSPISSCFLLNSSTDLEEEQGGKNTGDKTIEAPLLIEKCYIRFEGEECKKHKEASWSGWKQQTTYKDCYNCNGDTQSGCDAIKNKWNTYCGNNTFNIFTSNSSPPAINVCTT